MTRHHLLWWDNEQGGCSCGWENGPVLDPLEHAIAHEQHCRDLGVPVDEEGIGELCWTVTWADNYDEGEWL